MIFDGCARWRRLNPDGQRSLPIRRLGRSGTQICWRRARSLGERLSISASGLEGTDPDVTFAGVAVDDRAEVAEPVSGGGTGGQQTLFELDDSGDGVPPATEDDGVEPPGAAKGPRDVELPPWSKGRYGTAVGRAVHGVLQAIDLATGEGLDPVGCRAVRSGRCRPYADIVRGCVRSALNSDVVRRAAARGTGESRSWATYSTTERSSKDSST